MIINFHKAKNKGAYWSVPLLTANPEDRFLASRPIYAQWALHFLCPTNVIIETINDNNINPYPADTFCPENIVCSLRLLNIFKRTPDQFYYRSKQYEPSQAAPKEAV